MVDLGEGCSCKHCKFLKDGHWTDNWGNLTLESTALPAGTDSHHEFLVHEDLFRWSSLRMSRKRPNLVQQLFILHSAM